MISSFGHRANRTHYHMVTGKDWLSRNWIGLKATAENHHLASFIFEHFKPDKRLVNIETLLKTMHSNI